MSDSFSKIPSSNIFKKNDPQDLRFGDLTKQLQLSEILNLDPLKVNAVIMGYPDDEGIKINGGRLGSAEGPKQIRKHFYKMTPSPFSQEKPISIIDGGDLNISNTPSLKNRHDQVFDIISKLLQKEFKVCTLGGGHDYGFPDFSAFSKVCLDKKKRPIIINFDAHLDVRPYVDQPHSGNPFSQLLIKYGKGIDFLAVGIQEWCNSRVHLNWFLKNQGQVLSLNQILNHSLGLLGCLEEKLDSLYEKNHSLGLSICMDGFSSAFSPGASQVFPVGLEPQDFIRAFRMLCSKYKPKFISIYETSPPFDYDDRTSKMASVIMHQWLTLLSD